MPYNFEESTDKYNQEIDVERRLRKEDSVKQISETPIRLHYSRQFFMSWLLIMFFYWFVFYVLDLINDFARWGLWAYFSYPSFSIIAELCLNKKVRFKYYEGTLQVGKRKFTPFDIKKVAITEYSPYYCKNSFFKIPAFNFVDYKEFSVQLTLAKVNGKSDSEFFFICSVKDAQKFMDYLYKHNIPYGHVEKEFRKLFFYY